MFVSAIIRKPIRNSYTIIEDVTSYQCWATVYNNTNLSLRRIVTPLQQIQLQLLDELS